MSKCLLYFVNYGKFYLYIGFLVGESYLFYSFFLIKVYIVIVLVSKGCF